MYCVNCGAEINGDIQFCPSCGARINGAENVNEVAVIENNVFSRMQINVTPITQATIASIYKLLEPLKRIDDENAKISRIEKMIKKNRNKANGMVPNMMLGGVIGMLIGWAYLWFFMGFGSMRIVIGVIAGAIVGFLITRGGKKDLAKYENSKEVCLNQINEICGEMEPQDISVLPPSYRFYNAAAFFYNAFLNQRAFTMQQAVNLYEDETRKDQMAMIQRQQMLELNSIRKSSQVTATLHTLEFIGRLF